MAIENNMLPVPLKYTYPVIMELKIMMNGNLKTYIYNPETNKWIFSFKKLKNIDIILWKLRWIFKIDSKSLADKSLLSDEIIKHFYSDKLPKTKLYIKEKLLENIHYKCNFFCIGDDIIDQYILIHSKLGYVYNYDFSEIVGLEIKTKKSYFTIYCNEISPITNNIIGPYNTTYENLILKHLDHHELKGLKLSNNKLIPNSTFLSRVDKKFGHGRFTLLSDYEGSLKPLKIKCNRCGNIYSVSRASDFINSKLGCCKICIQENNKIILSNHSNKSYGEIFVSKWIEENKFSDVSDSNVYINGVIKGRNEDIVIIDFIIILSNITIWIEYNGKQHYRSDSLFYLHNSDEFIKQLSRDNNIRIYCKENNILLIEIPYIYNTYEKVKNLLDRVILDGEDINTIVDYQSLYKI